MMCPQLVQSPRVFMLLCRRCEVCLAAKAKRQRSGWALLLAFFSPSFSSSFWQAVHAGAVSAVQAGVGLLRCSSSSARVGLTALAGVQRGASAGLGMGQQDLQGRLAPPAKYAATGGWTRQPCTYPRGLRAGRDHPEVLQRMESDGEHRKKCLGLQYQCCGKQENKCP